MFYKIRNKKSGLYSKGGSDASSSDNGSRSWSKNGKAWQGPGPLRNHLNVVLERHTIPEHWEIVELEMVEKSVNPTIEYISPERLLKLLSTKLKINSHNKKGTYERHIWIF